ncbi:MAG: hypothetical protein V1729_04200 [Candidatus Woesearchaeota archaeon]
MDYDPESIDGVIELCKGDLFVKSPDVLPILLEHLSKVGYEVSDVSSGQRDSGKIWEGKLRDDIHRSMAECLSCNSIIEPTGVGVHNHECEVCGEYTTIEYVPGGQVCFSPTDDLNYQLTMVIHSYADDKLNLYADYKDCTEKILPLTRIYNEAEHSFNKVVCLASLFPETFSERTIHGVKVLSVDHKPSAYLAEHDIDILSISGKNTNYRNIEVFKGKKFTGRRWNLPIPTNISIVEAWHWIPLSPSPGLYSEVMSMAGQVSRKDYYYQDGRPGLEYRQVELILKAVREFTTVDVNSVNINHMMSGPALIDRLAEATGHDAVIETPPNIFNAINVIAKVTAGEQMTANEIEQGMKSLKADAEGDQVLLSAIRSLKKEAKPSPVVITAILVDE